MLSISFDSVYKKLSSLKMIKWHPHIAREDGGVPWARPPKSGTDQWRNEGVKGGHLSPGAALRGRNVTY